MFSTIVVGTDGSETATEAVRQAVELATAVGGRARDRLRLRAGARRAAARRARSTCPRTSSGWSARARTSTRPSRRPRSSRRRRAITAAVHARQGDPADAILDVAEETGADLVVIGNKGMTGAKRFLLGSVPNKISHHAPCGVLIIRTS